MPTPFNIPERMPNMVDTCESLEGIPFKDEEISPKESMYECMKVTLPQFRNPDKKEGTVGVKNMMKTTKPRKVA